MLMGVETVEVKAPFDAALAPVAEPAVAPEGRVAGSGPVYILDHAMISSTAATNRLLKEGADVSWATQPITVGGRERPPGAILVRNAKAATVAQLARDLRLPVEAAAVPPVPALRLRAPRLALYEPWGGNMDAGWTRWLLEQHEFPYTHARNADIRAGDLRKRFDVIVVAEMTTAQIVQGNTARNVRPEYAGGIGDEGVRHLKAFVEQGGTLITLGNAAQFAIEALGAPFENALAGLDQDTFFCPGSLLRIAIDTRHPVGYGMPEEADAMFINNGGYRPTATFPSVGTAVVARYPQKQLLRSGWIIGEARLQGTGAVLEARIGRGRIILQTMRVQNRAQTWGTFPLFFNSIFYGAAAD
jgi:hypothetical protein